MRVNACTGRQSNENVLSVSHQCPLPQGRRARAGCGRLTMLQICAYPSGAVYAVSEVLLPDSHDHGRAQPRRVLRTCMIATPTSRRFATSEIVKV